MLQKIINTIYRHPKAHLNRIAQFGGLFSYNQMLRGQKKMQEAALKLTPVTSYPSGLPVYFLTGKKYLYQTLFCITSLSKVTTQKFAVTLVDDGSFDAELTEVIEKLLPGARIISGKMIDENLERVLPASQFPTLRQKRAEYAHIKKLTDIHSIPGDNWKLVLDSDMLFWAAPTELINWLKNPDQPIHMVDCARSYGYSDNLMEKLCEANIPELLNVGVIGLNSTLIDWNELERWTATLEAEEGKTYYLEQALTAMLVAKTDRVVLDRQKYLVNPTDTSLKAADSVLHHYVDLSKKYYYTTAWQKLI